jgi:hypothetical protein
LATETTENVTAQSLTTAPVRQTAGSILGMPIEVVFGDGTREWVSEMITIATTRYNEQQFAPVETRLDAAVAAVDTVVTQTMTQAQAIDQIATTKQTRPDEGCPAKYCLLVEDEDGTPHWYPIAGANGVAHNLPAGYTELQYIESTGKQYINTGVVFDSGSLKFEADVYTTSNISTEEDFIGNFTGASLSTGFVGGFTTNITFLYSAPSNVNVPRVKQNSWQKYIGEFTNSNQMILTYDGTTVSASRTGQYNSSPIVLFRGSESYKPATHIRLGIVSIYLNNTMVRDFIPAKNASGVVGMYDMVSGQFFTNAGTGTFVAGPDM